VVAVVTVLRGFSTCCSGTDDDDDNDSSSFSYGGMFQYFVGIVDVVLSNHRSMTCSYSPLTNNAPMGGGAATFVVSAARDGD
jgi:hypothetical protein